MTKPKDAGFFSLHIEKILLLTALVVSAAMAMLYVVGSPNDLTMKNQSMSPSEAAEIVVSESQKLRTKLNDDESVIEKPQLENYHTLFNERAAELQLAVTEYHPIGYSGIESSITGDPSEGAPTYYRPLPPVVQDIVVRSGNGVFDSTSQTDIKRAVLDVIPTKNLDNWRYVSVGAKFPIDDWMNRLSATSENADLKAIPKVWWQPMLYVTAVYLERQEMDPYTGKWGPSTFIQPMPSQIAFKPSEDPSIKIAKADAQMMVSTVKGNQSEICRPTFLPLEFPLQWVPPDSKQLSAEDHKKLFKLQKKIASAERNIEKAMRNIEKIKKAQNRSSNTRSSRPSRQSSGGFGGFEGDMGDMMGGGRSTRTPRTRSAAQTPEQRLQEQIKLLEQRRIDAMIERDELLGRQSDDPELQNIRNRGGEMMGMDMMGMEMGGPGGYPGMNPYGPGTSRRSNQRGNTPENNTQYEETEDGQRVIPVWAHDVTAEPGKTYRYRMIVTVLNPLFRQNRVEAAQKDKNYHLIALKPSEEELEASPWSEPVTLDPQSHFFMVGNTQQGATVEVWALHLGSWYSDKFTVRAGDMIGGTIKVDDPKKEGNKLNLPVHNGSIMIDMIQSAVGGGDTQLLYLKPDDTRISYRSINGDKDNDTRIRLQNEAAIFQELLKEPDVRPGMQNMPMEMMGMDMMEDMY
ncbi:hypothetical protein [Poriferisphaera sp. WC338]|uniref:hypothetical protein n=1 Tax=Poriferisphaera sp. WC338 TaxID=3425129 RepID=UPI003D8129C1